MSGNEDGVEELNNMYLRRLVIDSLMVHSGKTLTPEIINGVALEVVKHFSEGLEKAKELMNDN